MRNIAQAFTRHFARHCALLIGAMILAVTLFAGSPMASDKEKPVKRDYTAVFAPPAPQRQSVAEMNAKSEGCNT
jgi:hypothetical protein